jgi:hypothetical protein
MIIVMCSSPSGSRLTAASTMLHMQCSVLHALQNFGFLSLMEMCMVMPRCRFSGPERDERMKLQILY